MGARQSADTLVVLTTLGSADEARTFVRRLVEGRLVACGTVLGPATSIYRWKGAIEEAGETQVLLKTRRDRWDDLQRAVRQFHPYDVPELIALPVTVGLPGYLAWLERETAVAGEASA